MGDFLGALASQISSQFSLGENTNHTLDDVSPDQFGQSTFAPPVKYGKLGDFAQHFDQSAERRYVEEGYLRKDPYNTDPKQFEILMQEPNATVLIKKKMFSSIGENFRPDFMDKDEKLYYKAMKVLFQNKCRQIAALEKLSKIQKITAAMGNVPDQLMPMIFTLGDTISGGLQTGSDFFGFSTSINGTGKASGFFSTMDRLRRIYAFNAAAPLTSWITDSSNLFQTQFGQGTGVIEITNFSNLTTHTSTSSIESPGQFTLSINDPYEAMLITEYDIERAIADASNSIYNHKIFQFSKENSTTLVNDLLQRLNHIRAKRNASPISLKVDPDTLLGKRVTAILDRLGIELPFTYDSTSAAAIFSGGAFGGGVTVPPEFLKGGATAGNDGLDKTKQKFSDIANQSLTGGLKNKGRTHSGPDSEFSIFNRLISTIFSKISLENNSKNAFQTMNEKTNYTRRKLRFNFAGKLIIQPMDTVHIYINSKSRFDTKLLAGLSNMFTGLGMLQNINNTLTNLANAAGALNPSGNVPLEIEKSAFVGSDFPNYLWSLVRGNFVAEKEGTHVFGGVVQNASDSWAEGKFTISVSGQDNTAYFDQGKINFKPAADVFNGKFYDPLTPFKSNFDTITSNAKDETPELLDENKYLLGSSKGSGASAQGAALVKFKLGRYAGQLVNEDDIKHGVVLDRNFDPVTGRITKTFYAPDGLVYKWKEGIGVFVQFGSDLDLNDPSKVGAPTPAKEPFAGQDVMNVISLLITGIPYNFTTFYKAAVESDGSYEDPHSKQAAAHSFIASLRNDLIKTNTLWGNFVPFKNLVIDEQTFIKNLATATQIVQKNKDLDAKIAELQNLNARAIIEGAANIYSEKASTDLGNFPSLRKQREDLAKEIDSIIKDIHKNDNVQLTGDDNSFDISKLVDSGKTAKQTAATRRLLRRQLNFLTRRMSYNVRANEDKNLFIVDDFYDKDFDLMAYEKALTNGIALYNNEFTSVRQKIMHVSQLLNLEVFCDSQGHIRCRPPQYNRMPSSVFYRMMYLKDTLGIQVFPQFLNDMFNDKLATLKARIEVVEDEIRLDCAILNNNTDATCVDFILKQGAAAGSGSTFAFLSNEDGIIGDFADLVIQANPDVSDKTTSQDLVIVNNRTKKQVSTKNIFNNTAKYLGIVDSLQKQNLSDKGFPIINTTSFLANTRVDDLISRIFTKSGQRVDKKDYIAIDPTLKISTVEPPDSFAIDVFKVVRELADKMRERQSALKLFYSTLKNVREYQSLDKDKSVANKMLTPGVYGKSEIPEVFEHMIEDETYDDYGLNSGKRYIIKRSQIRNLTIAENPPPYTAVHVQGLLNPFASGNDQPQGLSGGFPDNGNGMTSAIAIDYDMWRTYGYKEGAPVSVPFLQDPASQCGPYATMLLSRNRKNILQGTCTIAGNEFMQPGEVVFLEDRQMLFYVTSVRHQFTFGGSFNTTLELKYGHPAGEYIPTVTDAIGKLIYNNKDAADLAVHRQDTSGKEINLGVILRGTDNSSKSNSASSQNQTSPVGTSNPWSAANSTVLNNIMYNSQYMVAQNEIHTGETSVAKIQIRVYKDANNSTDPDVMALANQVRDMLIGKAENGMNAFTQSKQGTPPTPLPEKWVEPVVEIDLSSEDDRRSPSQKAIDAARNLSSHKSTSGGGASSPDNSDDGGTPTQSESDAKAAANIKVEKDAIRTALFKYVVDCWIAVVNVPQQKTNGS